MVDYQIFLSAKRRDWTGTPIPVTNMPQGLFLFQAALTRWALRKGRAGIFATTGLGKTRMQLAWAANVPGRVLIFAPLAVGQQTIAEGAAIGVTVAPLGRGERIEITNYERLHHVTPSEYAGIVLDESSILKAFDGKTRTRLIAAFADTPYRLCCTATPAPNDIAEIANHCEFLGIMSRKELFATFFVHDENGWRLRGHATDAFYAWLASWAIVMRHPSDLDFTESGYDLPALTIEDVVVDAPMPPSGSLFPELGLGIRGRLAARRTSLEARTKETARLVQSTAGPWIIWCGLNDEQDTIAAILGDDCVSITGSNDESTKETRLFAFIRGERRVLITKPRIAGFGLNLQHCAQMCFLGLGDSYEQYFQAIRRCWRFGQSQPVRVVIIVSRAELAIVDNVRRKEQEAERMADDMLGHMRDAERHEIAATAREVAPLVSREASGNGWRLVNGDCVDVLVNEPAETVDLSVYSPPFLALYTYTNSERDLGNCVSREDFFRHFRFVADQMFRVTKRGRLNCCHISQTATTLVTHGVIGLSDLRGGVIDTMVAAGWVYHGEVCIDKDPQAQAIRTHAKGLLFVQLKKDASWLRPGLADYILVFRKPGDPAVPIHPDISNDDWIEWARPVWYGIRESNTLNPREGRASDDDRHVCPLQLPVIERCIRLWSNPGDRVLSPFAGIGSEGYEAIRLDRQFLGIELKPEYWDAGVVNLRRAEYEANAQLQLELQGEISPECARE